MDMKSITIDGVNYRLADGTGQPTLRNLNEILAGTGRGLLTLKLSDQSYVTHLVNESSRIQFTPID
jgi:hypothetical protein